MVSIPACHAGDPGSIPGNGEFFSFCSDANQDGFDTLRFSSSTYAYTARSPEVKIRHRLNWRHINQLRSYMSSASILFENMWGTCKFGRKFFLKETFFFKKILVKKLIPSAFPTIIVQLFQGRNLVEIITLELFYLTYPLSPSDNSTAVRRSRAFHQTRMLSIRYYS